MLDIMDKHGKVVAVIMDDGTVIRKDGTGDDIDDLIRERLEKMNKKGKH